MSKVLYELVGFEDIDFAENNFTRGDSLPPLVKIYSTVGKKGDPCNRQTILLNTPFVRSVGDFSFVLFGYSQKTNCILMYFSRENIHVKSKKFGKKHGCSIYLVNTLIKYWKLDFDKIKGYYTPELIKAEKDEAYYKIDLNDPKL